MLDIEFFHYVIRNFYLVFTLFSPLVFLAIMNLRVITKKSEEIRWIKRFCIGKFVVAVIWALEWGGMLIIYWRTKNTIGDYITVSCFVGIGIVADLYTVCCLLKAFNQAKTGELLNPAETGARIQLETAVGANLGPFSQDTAFKATPIIEAKSLPTKDFDNNKKIPMNLHIEVIDLTEEDIKI